MEKLISYITALLFMAILPVSYAELPERIIENFSDYRLDCENQWGNKYYADGEVYTENGELHILYHPYSDGGIPQCGMRSALAIEGARVIETTVRIEEIHALNLPGNSGRVFANVFANFFGTAPVYSGNEGQVYAYINIGLEGTTMVAKWVISVDDYDVVLNPGINEQYREGYFSTSVQTGVDYPVRIEYDETNSNFIFTFAGQTITEQAPPNNAPPEWDHFRLQARANFNQYPLQGGYIVHPYLETSNKPIHVVYGDVFLDNNVTAYDTFANTLDLTKWIRPERKRLNQNGVHKFSVKAANPDLHRIRFSLPEEHLDTKLLGATVRLESSTAAIGRLRVGGQLFNVLYDDPADYNGQEGNVFGYAELRRQGGNYFAQVWMGQSLNADFTLDLPYIDGVQFAMPIDPTRFYELSVETNDIGDTVFKIIDDNGVEETQAWFNDGVGVPATPVPIFTSSTPYKAIELRAQEGAGEVVGYVDDIYIEGDDSLCFPIKAQSGNVAVICL